MQKCLIVLILALCAGMAFAGDIVTMPTANQVKKGEIDLAAYYLDLDLVPVTNLTPRFVQYETLYVGVTDWLELDLHQANVDRDKNSTVVVASAKLMSETETHPDVVVGIRNLLGAETTNNPAVANLSGDQSYYVSVAKTYFKDKPGPPLVRLHASWGTADWTLLGEKRHDGLFGGMQFLFKPDLGAVVEYDGTDTITGLTYMPMHTPGLTLKAGTFGTHQWYGVSYAKTWF